MNREIQNCYHEVAEGVQFNNLSSILVKALEEAGDNKSSLPSLLQGDENAWRKFGGNCIYQNQILQKKLIKAGFKVMTLPSGYHVATVCFDGHGDVFFLDPTLLHDQIVSLNKLRREGQVITTATPNVDGAPTVIRFDKKEGRQFSASIWEKEGIGYTYKVQFNYDLSRIGDLEAQEVDAWNKRGSYLTQYASLPGRRKASIYQDFEGNTEVKLVNQQGQHQKYPLESVEAEQELEIVAARFHCDVMDVLEFFEVTRELGKNML